MEILYVSGIHQAVYINNQGIKYVTNIILSISDIQTLSCCVPKIECGIESMEYVGP